MAQNTLDGDFVHRNGLFTFAGTMKLPDSCLGDAQVDASTPLSAQKVKHQPRGTHRQAGGAAIATLTEPVHHAYGATGQVVGVRAFVLTPGVAGGGGMSVTVDVKKNGVSILSAVVTITTLAALTTVDGTVADADYVTDDKFTVEVTATAGSGTLPQGLHVEVLFEEAPA